MVYVFFADGFEEIEAVTIVDVLRRGGVEVATVGIGSRSITGTHGMRIETDIADTDAAADGAERIVRPGGQGQSGRERGGGAADRRVHGGGEMGRRNMRRADGAGPRRRAAGAQGSLLSRL